MFRYPSEIEIISGISLNCSLRLFVPFVFSLRENRLQIGRGIHGKKVREAISAYCKGERVRAADR